MVASSSAPAVFLIPASSVEDQEIIETTLKGDGLTRSKLDNTLSAFCITELSSDVQDEFERLQSMKETLQDDLQGVRSAPVREDTSNREQQLTEELEEIKEQIENIRLRGAAKSESLDSSPAVEEERVDKAFERLRKAADGTHEGDGVYCWPISSKYEDKYELTAGDLFLFYTGNDLYEYAAKVTTTIESSTLGRAVLSDWDRDRARSTFVLFSTVKRIQVDSSVIAEIADRDLTSVQNFASLDSDAQQQLVARFNGLGTFLEEAQTGIYTVPQPAELDELDGWLSSDDADSAATTTSQSDETSGETVSETGPETAGTETNQRVSTPDTPGQQVSSKKGEAAVPEQVQQTEWSTLARALRQHKLVTLVGPQGTGKRRVIEALTSEWLTDKGRVDRADRVLQTHFHAELEYSDFVLGQVGDGSDERSSLVTGPFGRFADLAAADTTQFDSRDGELPPKYIVIIEDFQAANPPRVFGDLWQAIRPWNRGPANDIPLSGSAATLWVPEEFYIIGIVDSNRLSTQHQAELGEGPFSLRWIQPDYEALRDAYGYDEATVLDAARDELFDAVSILALEHLNTEIRESDFLDDRHVIGQLFLSRSDRHFEPYEKSTIHQAWQYEIFSTLAGYHKDGLPAIGDRLLGQYLPDDCSRLTLGQIHSDTELVHDIVTVLATAHPDF